MRSRFSFTKFSHLEIHRYILDSVLAIVKDTVIELLCGYELSIIAMHVVSCLRNLSFLLLQESSVEGASGEPQLETAIRFCQAKLKSVISPL